MKGNSMVKIHYNRIEFKTFEKINPNVFKKLEEIGITKLDIESIGVYRFGRYAFQPAIVFLKDGRVYKVGTKRWKFYVKRIR